MKSRIPPHEHTPTSPIVETHLDDQTDETPLICWVLVAIAFGLLMAAGRGWLSN